MKTSELLDKLEEKEKKYKSKRMQAIFEYAIDEIEEREDVAEYPQNMTYQELRNTLLNGAKNWVEYSMNGCSLIYDCDILERLPKSFKRYRNSIKLLEIQANYLHSAVFEIFKIIQNQK